MSVSYKLIPKQNNLATPPEVKYYPCVVTNGEVGLKDLAKIIATRSTISKADCYGVIMALCDVIGDSLSDGKIVRIDSLGSFQVSAIGEAAESVDSMSKSIIKGTKILYKPSKDLKNTMKNIKYKKIK